MEKEMQSNSAIIETAIGDKQVIKDLLGGLSLIPYGIFALLSAYAFAQGWLNWETNGGPPFLGGVLAWLIDKSIRWYYRRKYRFVFDIHKSNPETTHPMTLKKLLIILAIIGLFVTWYIDANFHLQIRFMPLWFGIFVCLRGIDWQKRNRIWYGLMHFLLGIVPIGIAVIPLFWEIPSNNQYFGIDGIYELLAIGVVIIIVGIMEHLIFLKMRNSG